MQDGVQVYRGLIHAARCILREEGFWGLYNGYLVKSAQLVSGILYISTYEVARDAATRFDVLSSTQRSFLAGATASTVAQTLLVPVDVVSQHLMLMSRQNPGDMHANSQHRQNPGGNNLIKSKAKALSPIHLSAKVMASPWLRLKAVLHHVFQQRGIFGFYHGYVISLCSFVPSSALWWAFYDKYCGLLSAYLPPSFRHSRRTVQLTAAPLAGLSASTLINPIDCVRVRMQVENTAFGDTVRRLWANEGLSALWKGLTARLVHSSIISFSIILFYEPVKILCLKPEYRQAHNW